MNRGRRPRPIGVYSAPIEGRSSSSAAHTSRHVMTAPDGSYSNSNDDSLSPRGGTSHAARGNASHRQFSPANSSRRYNRRPAPQYKYRIKNSPSQDGYCQTECSHQVQIASNAISFEPNSPGGFAASDYSTPQGDSALLSSCSSSQSQGAPHDVTKDQFGAVLANEAVDEEVTSHHLDSSIKANTIPPWNVTQLSLQSGANDQQQFAKSTGCTGDSGNSENPAAIEPFDICPPMVGAHVKLKPSLFVKNKEKRNEIKRALESQEIILGPGMVHLKGYLSMDVQVEIVKQCRELGLGDGGFYQPGYQSGAKLHLKMMCLGKDWEPGTGKYRNHRPIDGAKPPDIPNGFHKLVERAMKDSIALLERNPESDNAKDVLPWMSPDICIINFYSISGQLGLHQDKDESEGSLTKGLPVVSFSIGDAGEFLYGNDRDEKAAKKLKLESGDVLIFGGKSRHIFHGVRSIHTNTAPKSLLEETNLRPGRLNLTFRQY